MGIVQRQGIKATIISFIGVVVGAISLLFIYPLESELYGYVQYLYSTAMFLVPFSCLGILSIVIRFFPKFRNDKNGNNGFLSLLNIALVFSLILFFSLVFIFKTHFYDFLELLEFNVVLIKNNEIYIGALTVVLSFVMLYQLFAQGYKRIVVPTIFHPFLFKIFLPILVLLFFFWGINYDDTSVLVVLFFCIVLVLFVLYTYFQNQLIFTWYPEFLSKKLRSEIAQYTMYGSMNMIGNVLAFRIDAIMISLLLGFESNGRYFMIYFIAGIVAIPLNSINQIAAPLISDMFSKNQLEDVEKIYQKSSINLLLAGGFIFILIWFTIEDVFQLAVDSSKFEKGKSVFLFLGIAKLFDMLTSVNTYIIIYSKYFRVNVLFVVILGVMNVVFNYVLIGEYDIVGAAMATCISVVVFNVLKLLFIYYKFKMLPFSNNTLKLLLVSLITFSFAYFMPSTDYHLLNIFYKGLFILILYAYLVLKLKISIEVSHIYINFVEKLKSYLG